MTNAKQGVQPKAASVEMTCERCQGNGEIVTDWEVYLHPPEGAPGDAGTETCPDCDGEEYE